MYNYPSWLQVSRKVHHDISTSRKARANVHRNGVVVADRYKCCQRPVTVDTARINKHTLLKNLELSSRLFILKGDFLCKWIKRGIKLLCNMGLAKLM